MKEIINKKTKKRIEELIEEHKHLGMSTKDLELHIVEHLILELYNNK
jgi:hypothetical protein